MDSAAARAEAAEADLVGVHVPAAAGSVDSAAAHVVAAVGSAAGIAAEAADSPAAGSVEDRLFRLTITDVHNMQQIFAYYARLCMGELLLRRMLSIILQNTYCIIIRNLLYLLLSYQF